MRDKVKQGYEKGDYVGDYRKNREIQAEEQDYFQTLFEKINGKKILDLGCGTGIPFDKFLSREGYELTGVDIAEKHVRKAKENVPDSEFIQGDFFNQKFEENSFDAIVSFYAIFHIPREEHEELLNQIRYWVKDDGAILITMGSSEMDDFEGEIGGEDMLWSSYSAEKNKEIVEKSGFNILEAYIEDWREESHLWILAEPISNKKGDQD